MALPGSSYILLQSSSFQTYIINKLSKQLSRETNAKISIGKVDIALFNQVKLHDVYFEGLNNDTILFAEQVLATIDTLKIRKKRIVLNQLTFLNSRIALKKDSLNQFNFGFFLDSLKTEKKDTALFWKINCTNFDFQNAYISYNDIKKNAFLIQDLELNIDNFEMNKDSLVFQVNNLTLNDGKNLRLDSLSSEFVSHKNKITLSDFSFKSKHSEIKNSFVTFYPGNKTEELKPAIDIQLNNSKVSFKELAEMIPSLKGMNQLVNVSGHIYGDIDDLKGRNISLKTGKSTHALIDFYINDFNHPEAMYLFVDLKRSTTTLSDISAIQLPQKSKIQSIEFPESLNEAGLLRYKGNFSGFLTDFVTFGTLESDMGIVNTDISVLPNKDGTLKYQGKIATNNFDLGELLKIDVLGTTTFTAEVDGKFDTKKQTLSGFFKGNFSEFEANNYVYSNIELDGIYLDKMYDGLLSIHDANLDGTFLGQLDLNDFAPEFDFHLDLNKILPGPLNLSKRFPDSEASFDMKAKFTGSNLNSLRGVILVDDGIYKNRNGKFELKDIQLLSVPNDTAMTLSFKSDFFDVEIEGNYDFTTIVNDFKKGINHFIPAIKYQVTDNSRSNVFDYRISVNELDSIVNVFIPDLKVETPFFLYGKVDSENADLQLEGSLPGFEYKDFWFQNVFIGNKIIDEKYASKFKFGEILHRNGMAIYNFNIHSEIANNQINNTLSWSNDRDMKYPSTLKTKSVFEKQDSSSTPQINIEGFPSEIYIGDSVWHFNAFHSILDSSSVFINNILINRKNQAFALHGFISELSSDVLSATFTNINLGYIFENLTDKSGLSGTINGSLGVSNLYHNPMLLSNLKINDVQFSDHEIGDAIISSKWQRADSTLYTVLSIEQNGKQKLSASGGFTPSNQKLDYIVRADSLSLSLLGTAVKKNLSNFSGFGSGHIKITGTTQKALLRGAIFADKAKLKIDYTQVEYGFSDSIYFIGDTILFDRINVQDELNNKGIFQGTLVHENFRNMIYNLTVSTPKILAINTTLRDNGQFYGKVIANGKMDILGRGNAVTLQGALTTQAGTEVIISMDYEDEMEQYDFFEFVSSEETNKREQFFNRGSKGEFNLNLNIEATPVAKVQLVYNARIGDIIKAQGEGILLFDMNKEGDISLSGDYSLTQGEYLFTLENVVNKRFSIEPGGKIMWSGDPYNALIDLQAVYKVKASLYDLLVDQYGTNYQTQRIPVECKILLTEELASPDINFDINFPKVEERIRDQVQQYFSTDEDMNRQILSLLILGKFYTPEYLQGKHQADNPNLIGTTASELFSNQLSNWLSQISDNVDIGLNYRPETALSDDELELALGTQIFNDRVTLNGNVGNNANRNSQNGGQIVGDFDMSVKIVPSGKIQFKAFNRSNNNLVYETAPYTQGIGLTFKEEYNSWQEFIRKIGSIFKKKDK